MFCVSHFGSHGPDVFGSNWLDDDVLRFQGFILRAWMMNSFLILYRPDVTLCGFDQTSDPRANELSTQFTTRSVAITELLPPAQFVYIYFNQLSTLPIKSRFFGLLFTND